MVDGTIAAEGRVCTRCHQWKAASEFFYEYRRKMLRPQCKGCTAPHVAKARETEIEHFRAMERNSKARRKTFNADTIRQQAFQARLKRRAISEADYNEMLVLQGDRCAICRKRMVHFATNENRPRMACIDHDHETGEVRGIICNRCNVALGGFRDSAVLLRAAVRYLEKHSANATRGPRESSAGPSRVSDVGGGHRRRIQAIYGGLEALWASAETTT